MGWDHDGQCLSHANTTSYKAFVAWCLELYLLRRTPMPLVFLLSFFNQNVQEVIFILCFISPIEEFDNIWMVKIYQNCYFLDYTSLKLTFIFYCKISFWHRLGQAIYSNAITHMNNQLDLQLNLLILHFPILMHSPYM